ncbi:LysR family transcriptional regulator [Clostridium boliviensis]|uniref:LysR family transcriptional regulator n=2 Tax=Bacillota TaxID=1239 RepID=A0ABU4GHH5_9CLOT|nr:LysR family transcriptional regulator [Clostridium boliviensis]MDW2797079.1 LysR family transcriptional regulator [Clostridium boliviensis]
MTKWIDDFLALAKYKNFSSAAESIYISQSALSKHIKAIENELGIVLFIRSNTKAELTEAGNIYLEYALNVRQCTQDLRNKLQKFSSACYITHITVGTIPCLAESGVMQTLLDFQEKFGNYSIEIVEDDQTHLLKLLTQQEVDAAICRTDLLTDSEYDVIPLVTDEMVLICSKNVFPFEQGSEIDLTGFKFDHIYTIAKESDIYRLTKKQLYDIGYTGSISGTFPRHMMLLSFLSQKGGCALLPRQLTNLQMFPQLTYYRIRNSVKTTIGFAKLSSNNLNPQLLDKSNMLFDFLKEL